MGRKGLGKGLDSLIPDIYDEDFDSNSAQSLEDLLEPDEIPEIQEDIDEKPTENEVIDETTDIDEEEEVVVEETDSNEESKPVVETPITSDSENAESDDEEVEIENTDVEEEKPQEDDLNIGEVPEEIIPLVYNPRHVEEVKKFVEKNPRITLWSSKSSAVFRYLRKTEPEFSISKEASLLIEEAVSKKYPEIWALFAEDEEN